MGMPNSGNQTILFRLSNWISLKSLFSTKTATKCQKPTTEEAQIKVWGDKEEDTSRISEGLEGVKEEGKITTREEEPE